VRPGRAADHSPPSSAAVMKKYSYTSTHPLGHTGSVTGSLYIYIYIYIYIYTPNSTESHYRRERCEKLKSPSEVCVCWLISVRLLQRYCLESVCLPSQNSSLLVSGKHNITFNHSLAMYN